MGPIQLLNKEAAEAFDKQSSIFDEIYVKNSIVDYKRQRTRSQVEKYVAVGSKILELNAGTGQDAVYLAQKGYKIHATDVAEGMLKKLNQKVSELNLLKAVTSEKISFDDLANLTSQESYDAIFSNFGGLNCSNQLDKVLASFSPLLKPNGTVILVIMPPFCLWEFMTLFKGNVKLAFRRFFAKKGAKAHIEGVHFLCWYYQPSYVIECTKKEFDVVNFEGLCTIVPPSYMENFPHKYPRLWEFLQKAEDKLKNSFPFRYVGDYFIITLRKKAL